MIITCEKCSTRFNLDDALIKDEGSKVRCSVCKQIFTVFPASDEPEDTAGFNLELEDTREEVQDNTMDSGTQKSDDFDLEEDDFSLESTDIGIEDTQLEVEAQPAADEGIETELEIDDLPFNEDSGELELESFNGIEDGDELELESFSDDEDEPTPALAFASDSDDEDEDIDFDGLEFETYDEDDAPMTEQLDEDGLQIDMEIGPDDDHHDAPVSKIEEDDTELEEDFELEFDVADDEDTTFESDNFELESTADDEKVTTAPDLTVDGDEDLAADDVPLEISDDSQFDEYEKVLEQETEPEADFDDEAEPEPQIEYEDDKADAGPEPFVHASAELEPPAFKRKKRKPLIGAPVLILVLVVFLFFGAYIASLMTGYKIPVLSDIKIPFLEQLLKKQPLKTEAARPVPNQQSVNGRFVTNTTAGTLFVITGHVDNPSTVTFNHIQVKGTLIVTGKKEAKTKTAYCGNVIDENILKTGNIADINKMQQNRDGHQNLNRKVSPGGSVPFMIVFSNLPEKLQNFTIKVSGFENAQK